jgi:hypothetical protein
MQKEQQQRLAELAQRHADVSRQQVQKAAASMLQIQETRNELEKLANKLQEQSEALRVMSRRSSDDEAKTYVLFANAHLRYAGAVLQGLRRTASIDRSLKASVAERAETRKREELETEKRESRTEARAYTKQLQQLQQPTANDMSELYGEIFGALSGEKDHA